MSRAHVSRTVASAGRGARARALVRVTHVRLRHRNFRDSLLVSGCVRMGNRAGIVLVRRACVERTAKYVTGIPLAAPNVSSSWFGGEPAVRSAPSTPSENNAVVNMSQQIARIVHRGGCVFVRNRKTCVRECVCVWTLALDRTICLA